MHSRSRTSKPEKQGILVPVLVVIGLVILVVVPVSVYLLTITFFNKIVNEGTQNNQGVAIAPDGMFDFRDEDQSGFVEPDELKLDQWGAVKPFDIDGDGALSKEEHTEWNFKTGGW